MCEMHLDTTLLLIVFATSTINPPKLQLQKYN